MNLFRIALRLHLRYRWFTLVNILGLSLGITCSLVIFMYAYSHLSTDAFHPDADRIYRVVLQIETGEGGIEYEPGTSLPMHKVLPEEFSAVEMAAFCMKFYSPATVRVSSARGEEKYREGIVAYANDAFLDMFAYEFTVGQKHMALSHPATVVISEDIALKYFGDASGAVGQLININNLVDARVTGVFTSPLKNSDLHYRVIVSLSTLKMLLPNYQEENFTWIGSNNWTFIKLAENTSPAAVQGLLTAFTRKHLGPDFNHWHFMLQPLSEMHFDVRYDGVIKRSVLWILFGVAVMLLLVITANYVNLTIAQAQFRVKEIGIRKFLGENRRQIFSRFMYETGALVIASLFLACIGIRVLLPVLNDWLGAGMRLSDLVEATNLVWVAAFALILTILAGYYPSVHLSGFNPVKAIAGRTTNTTPRATGGKLLLTFQYAVAVFFLVSTVAIVGQVDYMLSMEPGFKKDNVILVRVPRADPGRMETFRDHVAGLSGVEAASLHNQAPISESNDGGFIRYDNQSSMGDFIVRERWADEHFLETYSLRLVAGRNFQVKDDTVREVLVNEALVRKLGISGPEEILGKPIFIDNSVTHGTVVGVVGDFHHQSMQNEIEPLVINPMKSIFNQVGIRLHPQAFSQTIEQVRSSYTALYPEEVFQYSILDETFRRMYTVEETTGKLMRVFSIVAVAVALIGILGLLSFSNMKRTKEIAIRKVLGATVTNIVALLCRQYLVLFLVSVAVGLPAAYLLADRWLSSYAYRINMEWSLLVTPALFLIALTLFFVGLQSLKTAMMNPSRSIRHE